ncbi:MAG: AAA family ATPase, partial [Caldimicrobium sp.]
MRPLYLSIKGFGPFIKGEIPEEIFRLIHQERFFLITGEIGAGKTTLFDAIFFALFGEATFPDRSPKDLISHHLYKYPHIEPEVVLKFLFKGQIYQILRKPPYEKRQNYVSALWINDRLYSQKKEEIAEKLKEIFGLEGKYFKKVFMLPQGEYRELLLSEPRERKALIEKLFDMDLLSRLENFFKERVNKLSQHLRNLEDTMKKILNLGEVNSLEELDLKI